MGLLRRIVGSIVGLGILTGEFWVERFVPQSIFEMLGVATLPDEIRKSWVGAMWSVDHLRFWLPIALGLAVICWANWEEIKMRLHSSVTRWLAVGALIVASFFISSLLPEGLGQPTRSNGPPLIPATPPSSSGDVPIGRDNNGQICTTGANCTFTPAPAPRSDIPPSSQSVTGDCNNVVGPNNSGPVNNNCNPKPIVSASAQSQHRTNDPGASWQTVFTISTTGPIQTGDLKLTCDAPCVKAGIGRISAYGFNSGANGPVPGEPNTVLYQLGPEPLSPGQNIVVVAYSNTPVVVISGAIGSYPIHFEAAK